MKKACLLCFALLLNTVYLFAQTTALCPATNTPGADNCADACIYCSLDGLVGQTAGYTAGTAPGFCSTAENEQWLGFLAGSDSIHIEVHPFNCQQGNGLEIALYQTCAGAPLVCSPGQAGDGTITRTLESVLIPGQSYMLMIDGFEGDQCIFSITTAPYNAVIPPVLDSIGPIQGPVIVSEFSSNTYTVAPVPGATGYTWSASAGMQINGKNPPVTLPAAGGNTVTVTAGSQNGTLCVSPNPVCDPDTNQACLGIIVGGSLIPPCPSNAVLAADLCVDACVYCNFNGYTGTTAGYTGQTTPGFCGTIENEQWLAFIAGAPSATFTATSSNCETGNGIQIALYAACNTAPIACNGGISGGAGTALSITANLVPGTTYFLMIDGYAGDQCDFNLNVTPPSAVQAPVIGPTGIISGPAKTCPGAAVTYSVPPVAGAGAYIWSAPPGWLINGQSPPVSAVGAGGNMVQIIVGQTGGQVCVQPINSCNTGTTVCKNVVVAPIPPTILPTVTICAEDAPYILPWGDECPSTANHCITLQSAQGCDSVVCQMVIVKAPIIRNLAPMVICPGDSVVVCDEVFSMSGSYQKVCTSDFGCDSLINFSVIVLTPIAEIISPGNPNCALPPITLQSASSPGIKTWKTLNGQVIGTGNTLTVTNPGMYILHVVATAGGNLCIAEDTIVILFGTDLPTATATGGTLNCVATSLQLDGSTNTAGAVYAWSGPGGFVSNLEDPEVSAPGHYTFTVTNPQSGCSAEATTEVMEDTQAPDAQLTAGTLTCSTPLTQIQCATLTADQFAWTGPDGFSSTTQNPEISKTGTYTVTLTNSTNGCTNTAEIEVNGDFQAPTLSVAGGTLTCANPSLNLSSTTNTPAVTYYWAGPGGYTSNLQNPPVTTPGRYDITVTAPNGCTITDTVLVLANVQIPEVNVPGVTLNCTQPTALLEAVTSALMPGFSWSGPGSVSGDQSTLLVTEPGTYILVVTDLENGCTNSATAGVTRNDSIPEVFITAPTPLTCAQTTVQLTGSTTANPAAFSWTGPDSFSSAQAEITVISPGLYVFTATDSITGCAAAAQVVVTQNIIPPGAEISGGGSITCATPVVTLHGSSPTSGVEYQWTGQIGGPALIVNSGGTYTLVVTNPVNGCSSTASATISADIEKPVVSIRADTVNCLADSIFIQVSDPQNFEFAWTGPNGFASQLPGFWISTAGLGLFTVTVTDPGNGCSDEFQISNFIEDTVAPLIGLTAVVDDQFGQGVGSIDIDVSSAGSYSTAWYRNGVFFSNMEDLDSLHSGSYEVVVTGSNGCTYSLTVEVLNNTVSTGAPSIGYSWEVFPNPASMILQLRYRGPGQPETQVQLWDVSGLLLCEKTARPGPVIVLSLESWPAGMYRLLIRTEDAVAWRNIVIQR